MKIVRVGLDVPLARCFDYSADACEVSVGQPVLVPFGRRTMVGVVLEVPDQAAIAPRLLKPILGVVAAAPPLSADDLRLLRFASDYYHYPLGQVVHAALPQRLRRASGARRTLSDYVLTEAGSAVPVDDLPARASAKRRVLALLRLNSRVASAELTSGERRVVNDFVRAGWATRQAASKPARPKSPAGALDSALPLTASQARAIDSISQALGSFVPFLLRGVTGSGKTEVYLQAAANAMARGYQTLILVPEIALTPQLEAMVRGRFPGVRVASLHSGLNENERLENWAAAQSGLARIVLGTRLAVFTPVPQLGLIVVDEEHDASFKQSEGFCYSARDLAVVRASHRAVPVILGSATPSLETYQNAKTGRYTLLELPERINGRPPAIRCISMRGLDAAEGLSRELLSAMAERLARNEQTLVFINRRGYAPVLMCHSCGWLSGCLRCSAQLVLHLPARELHCHHCGHRERVPSACPGCGNPALSPIGQGTQRIEAALVQHFPSARIARVDRDSTRRKHAWAKIRDRIRAREIDILVGTQMLAKGHDFPHLALVGVLNADSLLYSADFRASERLYALLTQVAGRAGRGEARGEVLIQTEFPDHPLYNALRAQDIDGFAQSVLRERRNASFPPYVYQALLRAEAVQLDSALEFLRTAREMGRALGGVELYEPVPAAMIRLAGRERAQLLVQSNSRTALHAFLGAWRDLLAAQKSSAARWTLEVDPLDL